MATILLVDDRPINREFLASLLGYSGYRTLEAENGAQALEAARTEKPELIITDILMPTMDGYEFVRQLRSDPDLASIPVIFYTATYGDREARTLAKAAGVQYVLTKPAAPEMILSMVDASLSRSPAPATTPEIVTKSLLDPVQVVSNKLADKMSELGGLGQRLEALVEIVLRVASEREPQRLLEIACEAARVVVGAKYAAIGMLEEGGGTLQHFVTSGMDEETIAGIGSLPTGKGILGKLLSEGKPLRIPDIGADPDSAGFPPGHPSMRSFLGVPLASPTGLYGRLYLTEKIGTSEFSEEDERVAIALAAQVAVAYENAYRYDEIQRHAAKLQLEIAERRRAEEALKESEERYRAFFQNSMDAILLTSPDGSILAANPAACKMLERTEAEITALGRDGLMDTNDPRLKLLLAARARTGRAYGELTMLRRDGTTFPVEVSSALFQDAHGELRSSMIIRDITERKRTEAALQQQQEELRRRNNELARLYRASEPLLSGALGDLPSLAQTIVQTVLREFEQSNCSLLLVNKETGDLERIAVTGPYAEQVEKAKLNLGSPGLVAKAVRTGQVINAPNVSDEPDYVPNWGAARSELVIPLKVGGEVIGALDVQSSEPSAFQPDDERLMTIYSERAALGLERTRLYEQTVKQLERLGALRAIDIAISGSIDLRLSLKIVIEQVMSQLKVDAVSVLLMKSESGRLEYVAGKGFRTFRIESTSLRFGQDYAGQAALQKTIVHVEDLIASGAQFTRRELLSNEGFVSYFGIPLIAKGQVIGVMEIFHRSWLKVDMEWLNFLDSLGWQTAIAVDNALLFEGMQRSNFDLELAYEATIEGWSKALDLRDKETEGHTQRVTETTLKLARAMGIKEEQLVHIRRGALLHDIGKMGVPDQILLKPAPLSDEEWSIMRMHPQFAYDLLSPIAYLQPALEIPYYHHEKWDGTGYPNGLKGEIIPLAARIFAVIDVWDALTSDRPYRKAWSTKKTLKYIKEETGKYFDPAVVEVFLKLVAKS